LAVEDVPLEFESQITVYDGQVAHLLAFAEHGQVAAVVVAEPHPGEFTLSQTEPEQQQERHPVALARLGAQQLADVTLGEGSAGNVAPARSEDRKRWVRRQATFPDSHTDAALAVLNAKAVARVTGGTPPSGF
jgi:hypothetical protein